MGKTVLGCWHPSAFGARQQEAMFQHKKNQHSGTQPYPMRASASAAVTSAGDVESNLTRDSNRGPTGRRGVLQFTHCAATGAESVVGLVHVWFCTNLARQPHSHDCACVLNSALEHSSAHDSIVHSLVCT